MDNEKCVWCSKPMGNSLNKSADGSSIHKKCQNEFKGYFTKQGAN